MNYSFPLFFALLSLAILDKPLLSADESTETRLIAKIDGTIRDLTQPASCAVEPNNPDIPCICCLINAKELSTLKTAKEILTNCITQEKRCTPETITSIRKRYNLQKESDEAFIQKLDDAITVIKKSQIPENILDAQGRLTEQTVPAFLANAVKQNRLPLADFARPECIKAKNIAQEKGGYYTAQLFLVTTTCTAGPANVYILKESKEGIKESINLAQILQHPGMKSLIPPHIVKGLPSLAFPLAFLSYPYHNKYHYISAMPAAKGAPLCPLLSEFQNDPTPAMQARLSRAYKIFGVELANFHNKFRKR